MSFSKIAAPFATLFALFAHPTASYSHSKGIYETQADAEKRATEIGCTTVHENNGHWMPCENEQKLHRQLRKQ